MEWRMPDLGEGVQEGEVIRWLVKEGDRVALDQQLVEIMTDKATMEIPSSVEGVVQKIVKKEGSVAKIGETLAVIGGEEGREPRTENREPRTESREPKAESREPKTESRKPKTENREPRAENIERRTWNVERPLAAPAVRALARELGVDLTQIHGSGPQGRVTKLDLENLGVGPTPQPGETRQPLRGLRRKIAEHMTLSRRTAAHFTHVDEADLTELIALRKKAKAKAQEKGIKLTFLPFIIKAVVEGLKKYPQMNASLDEERKEIILKSYHNIGVAVATEEGLIVPVVKDADKLSVWDLAKEISRLGEAARNKKTALEDLKGGTFTITNIGSIGGVMSAPIINYPEVAIMGLHQIKPRVVVKDDKMVVRQMMYISISADHRVVDGAEVAAFLKEVIGYLEKPKETFVL